MDAKIQRAKDEKILSDELEQEMAKLNTLMTDSKQEEASLDVFLKDAKQKKNTFMKRLDETRSARKAAKQKAMKDFEQLEASIEQEEGKKDGEKIRLSGIFRDILTSSKRKDEIE